MTDGLFSLRYFRYSLSPSGQDQIFEKLILEIRKLNIYPLVIYTI